ncbi:MAG: phosphatidylinositol-specific phospholipase C/glycerophosphodiester phosphodiesterase family protein [Lewinella sp.]|nr:phosphatidylinositol-specific phospholipase C/glycerophosphodiester phosphodiesterase family protein [Lewinella sp.]
MHFNYRMISLFLLFLAGAARSQSVTPLPNAHAHNDYKHKHPLHDALGQGFTSVEADVFLMGGDLIVAHHRPLFKRKSQSLETLYLKPLAERVKAGGGAVYPGFEGPFYLMIDFKTEGEATWAALDPLLAKYGDILSVEKEGVFKRGAVTVFLSGNRPFNSVAGASPRYAGIDGRPGNLGQGFAAGLMPVVSDNFHKVLSWTGNSEIPAEEWEKLTGLVNAAHAEGKKVRLWASPDTRLVWGTLLKAGVDLINADDLVGLRGFLVDHLGH